MKKALIPFVAILLLLVVAPCSPLRAQEPGTLFSFAELEDLLAPIALYPDPLLAQILPASTFVDQIDEAARYVRLYGVTAGIDAQGWDMSVKAVAHYPDILFMMDREEGWTTALGQAFVTQEAAVMAAIQRLRAEALAQGNLVATPQQQVLVEGGIIRILPALPERIFVPVYDPYLVYLEPPPPGAEFLFFGSGFLIGAWLNRDCDWHRHRIYYHGWQGGGWIGRARSHIRLRRNYYVDRRFADIRRNRLVTRRDTRRFRERLRRDVRLRRERHGNLPTPGRQTRPSAPLPRQPSLPQQRRLSPLPLPRRPSLPVQRRPQPPPQRRPTRVRPAPAVPGTPLQNRSLYRGRDLRQSQPPSQRGYGGYGAPRDAQRYRERGRRSLENMQRLNRSAPQRRPGATRGGAAGRPAVRGTPPRGTQDRDFSRERQRQR